MASDNSEENSQIFTPADRIKQLNDIDKDVAQLLESAGHAVKALTDARPDPTTEDPDTLEKHKTDFGTATSQYFALLSSIDVRLRRQIYALEEADIIPTEKALKEQQAASGGTTTLSTATMAQQGAEKTGTTGGLGNLDVGWLNSRNDAVGKAMDAELWAKARDIVEKLNQQSDDGQMGNIGR
ncbi:MAG: hypothetical protein M1834_002303 [Cirrosporium novae-zelandiae]|nr:MAG: hypothetical protein M1834_002303 [Cirrosporium novae-zelandiae]